MVQLQLEAVEFEDETRWRWRLTDPSGAFLADHLVELDRTAPEYRGFVDPYRYTRWHADPSAPLESQDAIAARVGAWIGRSVWGAVGELIVERSLQAPVTVRVRLPPEAEELLVRPLELSRIAGRPLAQHDVSLVFELGAQDPQDKAPIGTHLRMLAMFSVPTDQSALNLRQERHELRRLVHRIAVTARAGIELRVLQYGVTQHVLREVLWEAEGWDVIHFSGHGLPEGLVLEQADGRGDIVPSEQLVELLWPARERLKLVTLSSCESAAAAAAQTLQLLGLPQPGGMLDAAEDSRLPSIAQSLVSQLGCAAVAMRYPVGDEFAIALCGRLYESLLRDRQPLPRALQVAIAHAAATLPEDASDAIATATPMLLGAAAAELSLAPPPGGPTGFDVSTPGLAYFAPEPKRFVGRVGALARASAALAPASERRAVVFHGMAGAGKTACALELAYRHERGRFEAMVWYRAPLEGQDIAGALAELAASIERVLPSFEMSYLVDDRERLEGFLPRWRQLLAERAILLVIDNVESLLTPSGAWRDERWALLIDASVDHDGLSRLVLTSRSAPATLAGDARVLAEPVTTLSRSESVLLARQMPGLGALLRTRDEPQEARELVRRVLETMQGNPELIRLADACAADREALRERLAEAAHAWGARADALQAFFAGPDDGDARPEEFLPVLDAWTRGTIRRLPPASRVAFLVACALEPTDRLEGIVATVWPRLWSQLGEGGEPPEFRGSLAAVVDLGLVEAEAEPALGTAVLHLHPAVDEAGRGAAPDGFQTAVDLVLASFWFSVFTRAKEEELSEASGHRVMRAGLAAAPYLLRAGHPRTAHVMLESVLGRDRSPRTLSALLPLIERVAEAQAGTPDELSSRALLTSARARQDPVEALPQLRDLLRAAEREGDYRLAAALASDIVNHLWSLARLEEALELSELEAEYTRRAGLGPWTQLADEAKRLQLLLATGRRESVLEESAALRERMERLPATRGDLENEAVEPWNVRETILDVALRAASELQRDELALELGQAASASKRERGASALEQAATDYNSAASLIRLGRYDKAEALLRRCRAVYETEGSRPHLARLFSAWAILADARRHHDEALRFAHRSLRMTYAMGDSYEGAVTGHNNVARYLASAGRDPAAVVAHQLAATVLGYVARGGRFANAARGLARNVTRYGADHLPGTFAELRARIRADADVDFGRIAALLFPDTPIDDALLRRVVEEATARSTGEADLSEWVRRWQPKIEVVSAAVRGDAEAREVCKQLLEALAEDANWQQLGQRIARILDGERDAESLLQGLDRIDTAIATAILAELDGASSGTASAR